MREILKNVLRRSLRPFGYEVRRISTAAPPPAPAIRFENFADLAAAYEHGLRDRGAIVPDNPRRSELLGRLSGTPPAEAYCLIQALARCRSIPGDVCEFGVAQGETSALIASEIAAWTGKRLHLFDSFEGLPKPSAKDELKDDIFSLHSMEAYEGTMAFPESRVRARLEAISFPPERYVVHRGFIDRVLREDADLPSPVSFAYVDFDFYEPIRAALDFLHGVTPPGAMIMIDDYDFFSTGAKAAVDEFVAGAGGCYEVSPSDSRLGHFAMLTKRAA